VTGEPTAGGRAFDLMLLDADMPGISGLELAQALRSAVTAGQPAEGPPVPVVLLVTDQRDRAVGKRVGIDFFVSKPVRQGRLRATLAEALRQLATEDGPATDRSAAGSEPSASDASAAGGGADPEGQAEPSRRPSSPAILLVEDNRINQLVAVRMLEKRGYVVDVASDGRVALEMYDRRPYQAILMDCQMPVLDGYQATAEIRRRETENRRLPILAMTANTMKGDREKCLSSGMDDYLGKPFTGESLDAALARVLSLWPAAAAEGDGSPSDPDGGASAPVLDPSVMEDLCGSDLELRRDLLTMFSHHLQAALDKIGAAIRERDRPGLLAEAHTLKGSSGSIGALRIAQLSDTLTTAARSGALGPDDQLDRMWSDLQAAVALTMAALSPDIRAVTPSSA
jgi:two-component system sensor histidine kinase/response regulator